MTANVGADYRFRGMPLSVGGNLNYTPDYDDAPVRRAGRARPATKRVFDVYALWTFKPGLALRLSASNWLPRDYTTGSSVDGPDIQGIPVRETSQTRAPTFINVQLRLEMKL